MINEDSQLHPLDFDALEKGDFLSQEKLESIFGYKLETAADQRRFGLDRLGLIAQIKAARPDLLPVQKGNGLMIAQDKLSVERLAKRIRQGAKGIHQATADLHQRVDTTQFLPEERQKYDHEVMRGSNAVVALHAAARATRRRQLLSSTHAPKLPPKEES